MSYTCESCSILKDDTEFHKDKSKKNGKCAICKTCYKFNRFLNTNKNKYPDVFVGEFFACIDKYYEKNVDEDDNTKRCTKCKEIKNLSEYVKSKTKYKGVQSQCMLCEKERINKNKEKDIEKNAVKVCVKCKIEKNVEEFYKDPNCKFGVKTICKICCKKNIKIYQEINKQYLSERSKIYRSNPDVKSRKKEYVIRNKIKIAINNKNRRERNKDIIIHKERLYREKNKEKRKLQEKNRRMNNVQTKLAHNCRARFHSALKLNCIKKENSIIDLIGCDINSLKNHLESQFEGNMSWSNYGLYGWHIDHIVPIYSFDLTKHENVIKCFYYKNLKPLWAIDNLKKSSKII